MEEGILAEMSGVCSVEGGMGVGVRPPSLGVPANVLAEAIGVFLRARQIRFCFQTCFSIPPCNSVYEYSARGQGTITSDIKVRRIYIYI